MQALSQYEISMIFVRKAAAMVLVTSKHHALILCTLRPGFRFKMQTQQQTSNQDMSTNRAAKTGTNAYSA